MKNLILTILCAALMVGCGTVLAHTPPGNDGGACHGANKETCRPDPQPSHGQDCQPHGANQDANDDHCGPSAAPTLTPVPSSTPSNQPSETPNFPEITPPATDTE